MRFGSTAVSLSRRDVKNLLAERGISFPTERPVKGLGNGGCVAMERKLGQRMGCASALLLVN